MSQPRFTLGLVNLFFTKCGPASTVENASRVLQQPFQFTANKIKKMQLFFQSYVNTMKFTSHRELIMHEGNEQRVKLIFGIWPHSICSMY